MSRKLIPDSLVARDRYHPGAQIEHEVPEKTIVLALYETAFLVA